MGHLLESSEMDGSEAMRIWKEAQYATRPSNLKNLSIQEMEHRYGQLYGIRPYLVQYNLHVGVLLGANGFNPQRGGVEAD
jgi:hypothetical protein